MTATLTPAAPARIAVLVEHPAPFVARFTLTSPDGQTAVFAHTGEMAAALHLSGTELARTMTTDQVAAAILAGHRRAGATAIRQHSRDDQAVNHQGITGRTTRTEWSRQRRDLWGSARRAQLCADLATRIGMAGDR